jgi:hypothetical protein
VYLPPDVKTGDPAAGFQVRSIEWIFPAERSNSFLTLPSSEEAVIEESIFIR